MIEVCMQSRYNVTLLGNSCVGSVIISLKFIRRGQVCRCNLEKRDVSIELRVKSMQNMHFGDFGC